MEHGHLYKERQIEVNHRVRLEDADNPIVAAMTS